MGRCIRPVGSSPCPGRAGAPKAANPVSHRSNMAAFMQCFALARSVVATQAAYKLRWDGASLGRRTRLDMGAVEHGMKNIVYFDLETQKSAEDVGGWGNIRAMRMSVGVTFSTARGDYRIYGERQVN